MDRRMQIARRVLDLFRAQPEVKEASLRGSLADGVPDEFSDIDVTVDVSGHDNGKYMQQAVALMHGTFDLHFHDFNCGMMPEWYIANFYLKGVSPFWQIDINFVAEPHCRTLVPEQARTAQDPVVHILKLWVVYFKHLIRGEEEMKQKIVDVMPVRVGGDGWDGLSAWEVSGLVLDRMEERATEKHREFIALCRKVYQRESANAKS